MKYIQEQPNDQCLEAILRATNAEHLTNIPEMKATNDNVHSLNRRRCHFSRIRPAAVYNRQRNPGLRYLDEYRNIEKFKNSKLGIDLGIFL